MSKHLLNLAVSLVALTVASSAWGQMSPPSLSLGTNTISISGAAFSDGSVLNGMFSYAYQPSFADHQLYFLLSADFTVGSSSGWTGFEYLFNIPGQTDTASIPTGPSGSPPPGVSQFSLDAPTSGNDYYNLNFQFQSADPTELVSISENLLSSADNSSISSHLIAPNNSIGSPGTLEVQASPEPCTLALASLGGAALLVCRRKLK